jgi:tetratricopeptide (TPR) repeat protein
MSVSEWLQEGIAAAKTGDTESAKAYFISVIEADERQIEAWLWLSKLIDDPTEKEVCLENMLALEPTNSYAQAALLNLQTAAPIQEPPPSLNPTETAAPIQEPPPILNPAETAAPLEETEVAEVAETVEEIEAVEETPDSPSSDDFENPLACPYCGVVTPENQATCISCRRQLIWRKRVSEDRSAWLWRGFFIQVYLLIIVISLPLGYVALLGRWNGIPNALPAWPAYLGLPVDFSPAEVDIIFTILPPIFFWSLVSLSLWSLLVMLTLYLRLANGHFLYLLNAAFSGLVGLIALLAIPLIPIKIAVGAFWVGAGLLQLLTALNLWNDFTFESGRIYMQVDKDASNTTTMRISARHYAKRGLWAKAILHWRRALAQNPSNINIHLELIEAYLQVGREDLARQALQNAQKIQADHPHIKNLATRLN